jgi:hypothetical protein
MVSNVFCHKVSKNRIFLQKFTHTILNNKKSNELTPKQITTNVSLVGNIVGSREGKTVGLVDGWREGVIDGNS